MKSWAETKIAYIDHVIECIGNFIDEGDPERARVYVRLLKDLVNFDKED